METYYGFVSTSEDALALFEACRLGYKQRVPRRLSDAERAAIRSGSVFVWEEGESGMKRWTDGRSWSPSRVQGCFLTYHEWQGRRRAQRRPSFHTMHGFSLPAGMHGVPMGIARYGHFIGGPTKAGSTQVQYGFPKENGMLKKALSIRTTDGMKLHIIAYYSKEDHAQRRLMTPTTDPNFPRLVVPPNLYPDMSPESMYGASHSLANSTAPAGDPTQQQSSATGACDRESSGGARKQSSGSLAGGMPKESRHPQRAAHATSAAMDISEEQPAPPSNYSPHRRVSPLRSLFPPQAQSTGPAAVEALSAGLHKARVQSLLMDGDVPNALLHYASRPAPERHAAYPHTAHPMSAPSSAAVAAAAAALGANTRPSSNSFSGGMAYTHPGNMPQYEAPLGLSASSSSSSAPASTVMRSFDASAAVVSATLVAEPQALPPIVSEATLMQAHSNLAARRGSSPDRRAGGRGRKYLGLGGNSLGLSGGGPRRSTPLRSVTTAAVMVHNPYAQQCTSTLRPSPEDMQPRSADRPQASRMHSALQLPLLMSPVSHPRAPMSARSGSFAGTQPINLAEIRKDVREGPRRLPSISASICDTTPPPTAGSNRPSYSPGGLGIFNVSSGRPQSLLPSPLPTPRQSLSSNGFEGEQRDSLSLLASAADRAQGGRSSRTASSGHHHPYSRSMRRNPTSRSVSLKQSEDIRQLGVLDQSLKLK
ncbi:Gluconate transport-inducing protein [Coemansia sp. RSA 552]|nr:Gluconate transport-inducing protein [Coemansia sp. RSA 552]